jgi:hypothetical protein
MQVTIVILFTLLNYLTAQSYRGNATLAASIFNFLSSYDSDNERVRGDVGMAGKLYRSN